MKLRQLLFIFLLFSSSLQAQNVGINNNDPQVSLDVTGAISIRPSASVNILSQPVSLLDVTNKSYVYFSVHNGAGGNEFRQIKLSAGSPGQITTLEFTGTGSAVLVNGSKHAGAGKILLSDNMLFQDRAKLITLVFNNNNWKELYRNDNLRKETDTNKIIYSTVGQYSFIVPPGIQQIRVTVNGAGGWGGGTNGSQIGTGGRGGNLVCLINTTEGAQLDLEVGAGGMQNARGKITYIKSGNTFLAVAAAGGNGSRNGGTGGAGGASGSNGSLGVGSSGSAGGGATVSSGGNGGFGPVSSGQNGSPLTGGINSTFNPGEGYGGDGWYGGGAAGTYTSITNNPWAAGGGGGGSNFVHPSVTLLTNNSQGSTGGFLNGTGVAGQVIIEWW